MHQTLFESETCYRTIFDQLAIPVILINPSDCSIIEGNKCALQIFGFHGKDLSRILITDFLFTYEEAETFRNHLHACSHASTFLETGIRGANGERIDFEVHIQPLELNDLKICMATWKNISALKRVEADAEKSKIERNQTIDELNAVINALPGLVSVVDLDFKVLTANNEVVKKFGHKSLQEVLGQVCYSSRKGLNAPCPQCGLLTAFKTKSIVVRLSTPDEEKLLGIATKAYAIPLIDSNGEVWGGVEVIMDVSDIRSVENQLRESRERLQLALSGADLGFWDWHIPSGRVTANEQWARMLGYQLEEIGNDRQSWENLIHPDDKQEVLTTLDQHIEGKTTFFEIEYRMLTKEGGWRWVLSRGKIVERDDEGKPLRAAGTHLDISERKLTSEKLAAEKELLAVTLRSIGDGVITTDTNSNIMTLNRAAELLTGWTHEEALGKPLPTVFNIVNEITRMKCDNPVEKVLTTRGAIELANHTLLITKDGREIALADSGSPIVDRNNTILGVVLVFRDESEKRKMQENAQRTDKLNSIGVLAGGIAHDFNNLFSGIFGYIDLAKAYCDSDGKVAGYLEEALKPFYRAKELTHQLLTFAKGGTPVRKAGALGPLLRECVQFALSGSNVRADFNIDNDLAQCDFDRNQISQIINNIIINAVQAMPQGGTISVLAENHEITDLKNLVVKPGKYIHIKIQDTGIGIPPHIKNRIFDPFFTTKHAGNGLGLATVYSIVKKHDGEITVDSEPGKGASFHLYFPVSSVTSGVINSTIDDSTHRGTGRILLMDDEEYIRTMAAAMLVSMGYEVSYAGNGSEALELLRDSHSSNRPFSAVILDLTIPGGMGGKDTVRHLREYDKELPVFVASGYSEDPVIANPMAFGFTDSIVKPFLKKNLITLLNRYCHDTGR